MKTMALISIMIFICATIFAQTSMKSNLTDEEINDLTSKLVMKLLLNESQKSSITNLLKSYRTELEKINSGSGESSFKDKQELMTSINYQIESLLDPKQKMKYDVLEKDWWGSITSEAND